MEVMGFEDMIATVLAAAVVALTILVGWNRHASKDKGAA